MQLPSARTWSPDTAWCPSRCVVRWEKGGGGGGGHGVQTQPGVPPGVWLGGRRGGGGGGGGGGGHGVQTQPGVPPGVWLGGNRSGEGGGGEGGGGGGGGGRRI